MPDSGAASNLPIKAVQLVGELKLHPDAPESVARVISVLAPTKKVSQEPDKEPDLEGELEAKVRVLAKTDTVKTRKEDHLQIVSLCDEVLAEIDGDALARHRGRRHEKDDDKAKKAGARFDREYEILTDTLYRKCRAIAYHDGADGIARTFHCAKAVQDTLCSNENIFATEEGRPDEASCWKKNGTKIIQ